MSYLHHWLIRSVYTVCPSYAHCSLCTSILYTPSGSRLHQPFDRRVILQSDICRILYIFALSPPTGRRLTGPGTISRTQEVSRPLAHQQLTSSAVRDFSLVQKPWRLGIVKMPLGGRLLSTPPQRRAYLPGFSVAEADE